jgi:hypothetical protein
LELIEQALRYLFREHLTRLDEKDRMKIKEAEREIGKGHKGVESFTMGELVRLFENSDFLEAWARNTGKDIRKIRPIKLNELKELRNRLVHDGKIEIDRSEAEFLFHCLQIILETFDIISDKALSPEPAVRSGIKKKILILAANPQNTEQLCLDKEVQAIDQGLRQTKRRDSFELKQTWQTRPQDIRRAMLDFEPNIVHFCGHGEGKAGIVFEDDAGYARLVSAEALAGLFELFADHVECVVLNACYSKVQAEAIAQHIEHVIGMNQSIGDEAAIEFAVAFYDALVAGKSAEFAYKLGCNAIQMAGIPEHLTPVFIIRERNIGLKPITGGERFEERFLDAAMPKDVVVDKTTELITMIRIPDSEGLREKLKDASFQARPKDVQSKSFGIPFPLDERGNPTFLELWITIETDDFKLIKKRKKIRVQIGKDSEECIFLLTPQKKGMLKLIVRIQLGETDLAEGFLQINGHTKLEEGLQSIMTLISLPIRVFSKGPPEAPDKKGPEPTRNIIVAKLREPEPPQESLCIPQSLEIKKLSEPIPPPDPFCIQKFLRMRVDLQKFCFVLQYKLNSEYAYRFLDGGNPDQKSMSLVQQADQKGDLGELVFHLVKFWLEEIHGKPRLLDEEGIYDQLRIYYHTLLEKGEQDKANQVGTLLNKIKE